MIALQVGPVYALDHAFNFDDWVDLARDDAAAFEAKRMACIEAVISRASEPNQHRLRCLQWRIEMERQRTRTPLQACLRLSAMMWDSLLNDGSGLHGALDNLAETAMGGTTPSPPAESLTGARILSFPRRP
ncbi:MAG TPA: DUF3135 domain-containing protein [Acidiferrobacteraceae bacterium]|nr:DUF3135 domain-containing protein [Acidiferrobacteraceae bacterium]